MEQSTLEFVREIRRSLDANKDVVEAARRARQPIDQYRDLTSTVRWAQDLMARHKELVDQSTWARNAMEQIPQAPSSQEATRWASDLLRGISRSTSAGGTADWAREALARVESGADPQTLISDDELFGEGTFSDGIEETDWAGLGQEELGNELAAELTGKDPQAVMERIVGAPPAAQVTLIAALLGVVLLVWSTAESLGGGDIPDEAQATVAGLAATLAALAALLACLQHND